jgi:hypothetical protein
MVAKITLRRGAGLSAAILAGLLLAGCEPLALPLPPGAADRPMVSVVDASGSFEYKVQSTKEGQEVWLVFSNADTVNDAATGSIVFNRPSVSVDGQSFRLPAPAGFPGGASGAETAGGLRERWNRAAFPSAFRSRGLPDPGRAAARVVSAAAADAVGLASSFWVDKGLSACVAVPAHCRQSYAVDFADGRRRRVSVWVADANWNDVAAPAFGQINQAMVDACAGRFLARTESQDDIYHLVCGIAGEPWGPTANSALIDWDADSTVTILLANLNLSYDPAALGGVVGYFWKKDNLADSGDSTAPSNRRIMFCVDASLYSAVSAGAAAWSAGDYWPEEVFSTLAHEFQHMIQFYQKGVLKRGDGRTGDVWVDEMCSMLVEDLVSEKLGVRGPRGVDPADGTAGLPHNPEGRAPLFNWWADYPWYIDGAWYGDTAIVAYSGVYMLGAWLARNFGGAEFVRAVVQGAATGEDAVLAALAGQEAAPTDFGQMLSKWAVAVLLSDRTDAPRGLRYNTGGWFPYTAARQAGAVPCRLGSLNDFNYDYTIPDAFGNPQTISGLLPYDSVAAAGQFTGGVFRSGTSLYFKTSLGSAKRRNYAITLPEKVTMAMVVK